MTTKKALPPIEGMSAGDAQAVCFKEGGWFLFEHTDSGHPVIDNWERTVNCYCPHNPRVGRTYAVATDLGVELDPIHPGHPAPRRKPSRAKAGMTEKKELPPIEGMSAAEAQAVCLEEGSWRLVEHLDSGHRLIDNWERTVESYCSHNRRLKGRTYAVATDLGVELDPIHPGHARKIARRKTKGKPHAPPKKAPRTKTVKRGTKPAPRRRSGK